jgi:GrpB-like predicted nucleotidyltransferase (UPF0157 family)
MTIEIQLQPHNSEWAATFQRLAHHIRVALGEKVLRLEHVGSTSAPGLAAKPIIDIVLAPQNNSS